MTETLRILHVVNKLDGGGMELSIIKLARALTMRGVQQMVCTLRDGGSEAHRLPSNIPLTTLNLGSFNPASSGRLSTTIRSFQPDIVHARGVGTWTDTSLAALRNRGIKYLLGFHGRATRESFSRIDWAKARLWTKAADLFTCVAESGKQQLVSELRIDPDLVKTLPNGTDTSRFTPCDEHARYHARQSLGIPDDSLVLGHVGSLSPIKDHATLLNAFADAITKQPNLFLVLVGEGPQEEAIRAQMNELGIAHRVMCTGWKDQIEHILPAFDLFVNSSQSESMCNAILEAMACGLPVVATAVGDTPIILDHGKAGFLVPPGAPDALSSSILEITRQPETRNMMGRAAREFVCEKFGMDRFEQNYLELYLYLSNPSAPPPSLFPQDYYL